MDWCVLAADDEAADAGNSGGSSTMHIMNNLRLSLAQNEQLEEILGRFEEIDLLDSWLVAGCIAQTIWNLRASNPRS
jgi:hypothetical protein